MKTSVFLSLFLILFIVLLTDPVYPAGSKKFFVESYYVDAQNGNDANSGHSPNAAWKTIQKVNATILPEGYQVLFKRGCTWYETLQITSSGTSARPIVYTSYGPFELPQPVIDGELTRSNCIYHYDKDYVTIKDLQFQNAVGSGAVRIMYSSYVKIENCTFVVTGHGGVFIENSDHCFIRSNTITSPAGDLDMQTDGIYSQRNSNNTYEKNNITLNNSNALQHLDGIQSYIDNDLTLKDNYIFQQNNKTNSQGIYATTGTGIHTYFNNVVYCPNTTASVMGFKNLTAGTATLRAYHNTLIGKGSNIIVVNGDPTPVIKNNIFVALSASYGVIRIDSTCINPSDINNNLYNNGGSTTVVTYKGANLTFAQWRTLGFEEQGLFGNPMFNADYTLEPGSPAINKGVEIGSLCGYDKAGIIRPQMGIVDLGAYESFYLGKAGEKNITPAAFELSQNYPNPFNPATVIRFSIPETSEISLVVYDLLGNEVANLLSGVKAEGTYQVEFNGNGLASGVYLYCLNAGGSTITKKMSLIK